MGQERKTEGWDKGVQQALEMGWKMSCATTELKCIEIAQTRVLTAPINFGVLIFAMSFLVCLCSCEGRSRLAVSSAQSTVLAASHNGLVHHGVQTDLLKLQSVLLSLCTRGNEALRVCQPSINLG